MIQTGVQAFDRVPGVVEDPFLLVSDLGEDPVGSQVMVDELPGGGSLSGNEDDPARVATRCGLGEGIVDVVHSGPCG